MRVATSNVVFPLAAILLMSASAAVAQTANLPSTAATGESTVGEVVVTGSRIARRDFVSDSPLVTVGASTIASVASPTLEASLNQLPQLSASAGSASSFNSHGGQANLDLRGLGEQRTLVLIDGIRLQPSNPDGSVDLNVIAPSLVENVELITGGASAVYGSDAIAGVVNLKLRQHFSGAEVNATYGVTGHGDGATYDVTALLGGNFSDNRGNAFMSFDYATRDAVAFPARNYLNNQALSTYTPYSQLYADTGNLPSQAAVNGVFAKYGVAPGTVKNNTQFGFNPNGSLFVENPQTNYQGSTTGPFTVYNGARLYNTGYDNLAQVPLTRYSFFGHSSYEANSHVSLYADFLFTKYTSVTQGPPPAAGPPLSGLSVPLTNPFVPADLSPLLASRPNPNAPFTVLDRFDVVGNRQESDDYSLFQAIVGGKGDFGFRDWTWNADATYGRTDYTATELNYPSLTAVRTLLAAPGGGAGLCTGGFNPFADVALSASCYNYIARRAPDLQILERGNIEANVSGSLFALPAGELRFAAGADYRHDSYSFQPASEVATGDLINFLPVQATRGSEAVTEGYGELLVPVLKDLPLIQELNLDAGYRYSNYDTIGSTNTYKIDGDWKIVDSFRLRGGFERAIRAPSVGELYHAQQTNLTYLGTVSASSPQGDPCDVGTSYRINNPNAAQVAALCIAQGVPAAQINTFTNRTVPAPFTTTGNPNLKAETADTFSVGAVWRPHFSSALFSKVSLSVDYYNISLQGAVGIVTTTVALQKCFNSDGSNPSYSNSNYFCGLVTRDPASGLVTQVNNPELNLGGYQTDGIDIAADWSFGLGALGLDDRYGSLAFSTVINRLNSFEIQTLPHAKFLDYAGTIGNTQVDFFADAHPNWKATSAITYSNGPVDLTLRWRYLGSMSNAANVGTAGTLPGVKAVSYFDLDVAWRISPKLELRAGVINLADQAPPVLNASAIAQYSTDLNTYDILGRRFTVSLQARF